MKILGFIPARLDSSRLPKKALLKIDGLPMIIHTLKRAKMSRKLSEVFVCTDSLEIIEEVQKYHGKCILTSSKHKNGTERVYEASKNFKFDLCIDIQGDEPFVNHLHIDKVIDFHKKNLNFDIIVPHLEFESPESPNIVKIIKDKNNAVLSMSRSVIPYPFISKPKKYLKHLSIISFKPKALKDFNFCKPAPLEKVESIELLRAIENNFKVGTFKLDGDSFSVDIKEDFERAKKRMKYDKIRKLY
jgi:3-deoxy-manno-octulosonate cytidylyltransferase (CMP-KDO synthetase)